MGVGVLGASTGWPWTEIVKAADEVVNNSAAQQNDNELQFEAEADSLYLVDFDVMYTSSVGADFRFWVIVPALANPSEMFGTLQYRNGAGTGFSDALVAANATDWPTDLGLAMLGEGVAIEEHIYGRFAIKTGAAGTVAIAWAQWAAEVSNTTVKAGSSLRYRKVE